MALATSSHACTLTMTNKSWVQSIENEKFREAVHFARDAMATRAVSGGESVFDLINERLAAAAGDREGYGNRAGPRGRDTHDVDPPPRLVVATGGPVVAAK